jgi:hypothetical protein
VLAALLIARASAPLRAQVVSTMTPSQIDQAIADGVEHKPGRYSLRSKTLWMEFDTPLLRVAERAASAPVADRSLATPDLIAPELRILAAPEPMGDDVPGIKKVVLERPGGAIVAATSQELYVDYAQSSRRKKIALRGVRAVFPIAALEPGARFRFLMSDGKEQLLAPDASWFRVPR